MAHFDDGEQEFDFPVVIDGLDENGTLVDGSCYFSWHNMLPEHNSLEYADELSPIPLTEEILEANGFKCFAMSENGTLYGYSIRGMKNPIIWDCENGYAFEGNIIFKHVHRFQQYIRLIGMEEIADNFKLK